jgi:hypothetical protein
MNAAFHSRVAKDQGTLAAALDNLDRNEAWFVDPERTPEDNTGPFVRVFDDFYSDPLAIRDVALHLPYVQYSPPLAEHVGDELAARFRHRPGRYLASANLVYHGFKLQKPVLGHRHNPEALRLHMKRLLDEDIEPDSWAMGGDGWNGAFHLIDAGFPHGCIHHHYKSGDVDRRGWSGVVYLCPDAPATSGTSIWRDKTTGRCIASYGATFHEDPAGFEQVLRVENRFNRLVLFRENVLHRGEHGFASGTASRLTQTFFFRTQLPAV